MRIVCPDCATPYEVPEARLSPGRAVHCARCGTEWVPLATPSPELIEAAAPEELEPPERAETVLEAVVETPAATASEWEDAERPLPPWDEDAQEDEAARPSRALRAAWLASVLMLLAAMVGAYAGREGIMHAWPASERAYAALGLRR